MRFEHPLILWLLLVVPPALCLFLWWAGKRRGALLEKFIQARLLPGLLSGVSPLRRRLRAGLLVVAVGLSIVALARPQWGFTWEEVQQRGLDIVVAIDTSKSMLAEDIQPNRLQRAKLAALDLLAAAPTDRLGLVAFAGVAFLQCPLTIDDAAFRQSLEALNVNLLPQGGTAIAAAINEALGAFKENNNYKVLVLFTDGEDHDSGAVEAARNAASQGLRIFTVGIGSPEGEVLRIRDNSGRTEYLKDDQGAVVQSRLNEPLLRDIAAAAQGFYLPLAGVKTIETLYAKGLAPLPRSEGKEKLVKRFHERYHWPLGLALVLLIIEILTPERSRETKGVGRKTHASGVVVMLAILLGFSPRALHASPSSALREYRDGNYEAALREYEALQKKGADPRLNYNAGVAAYRDGQLEEAARQFGQALSAQDLELQEKAYFNRGNTHYYMGEAAREPKQRTEAWQQALKDFESSMKLNPQAPDAKFNHEFVKRRLEELKQQQQQQQENQPDKNEDQQNQQQDQQQQQQQGNQQQSQDQPKNQQPQDQQQPQQAQSDQRQDQQKQAQAEKNQADQQEAKAAPAEPKPEEQQPSSATSEQAEDNQKEGDQQSAESGKMTRDEARRLLDAQKSDENMLPMQPEKRARPQDRPFKDW